MRSSVGLTFTPLTLLHRRVSSLAGRFAYKHNEVLDAPSWGVGPEQVIPTESLRPSFLSPAALLCPVCFRERPMRYVYSVTSVPYEGERVALLVEGISELARLILDALTQHNVACRVVLKNNGEEALDYLLGRGAYAERDLHVMPCVTLICRYPV